MDVYDVVAVVVMVDGGTHVVALLERTYVFD
jgi:hypothetical protein